MRSNHDAAIDAAARSRPRSPQGGKALQRLFYYLGRRDTALNDEVVSAVPVPRAARPRFHLTAAAMTATPGRPIATRARGRRRVSESFAAGLIDAVTALAQPGAAPTAAPGAAPPPPPIWQSIGPTVIPNGQTYGTNRVEVIGRVAAVAVDPANANHVLCGGAGGGIWESFDHGATWAVRTDQMPSLAIGAVAFDPQHPNIVYAGSGEGNFYFALGAGIYQSTNGGTTWQVLASAPFVGVGFFDIAVSQSNPQDVYAATTNGFYASTNGGTTWTQRRAQRCWGISVGPTGGAGAEILASFADGLFASANRGATFTPVKLPGAPTAQWTRLDVDRVMQSPDTAYVFGATAQTAYLWRRTGTTWRRITTLPAPPMNITQSWYDWYVAAPPDNVNQVFLGAIDAYRGNLAGGTWTWTNISTQGNNSIHPDQHCLAFAPGNSRIIYAGSDGGLFRSDNAGAIWTALNKGLGITEVEYMATDPTVSNWLIAGTQDNGTIRFVGAAWDHVADGDGGDCGVNPLNPLQVYHSYYYVSLERSNNKGNTWVSMNPPSMSSLFYPPVCVFGTTVAIGGNMLLVTRNGAPPWTTVSLGLGTGDLATASCIRDADTIYVGTQGGRVFRIRWNGSSWVRTALTSPFAGYVSCIALDPSNPQRLWATSSQLSIGAMVCRSDDGGATWVNCTAGLPAIPKNTVVVDPANGNRVWVGADVGVYQSTNSGVAWSSFSTGLPNAMAIDLLLHQMDRKLYCGTRNRGVWVASV